jgi:tetratricopeptide (TPR) repeat protein
MSNEDKSEIFELAKERFRQNDYRTAEILLQQAVLAEKQNPEAFHMLGTIYYDQGKFNKAIKSFERALEIDPSYTDASVGLSIILNDLGRYGEGQKVFEEAQKRLEQKSQVSDPYTSERLAIKHEEVGQMYFQCKRYKEALEQYLKASELSTRTVEITMKIVDCFEALLESKKAIKQLRLLIRDYPQYVPARVKLGKIYYNIGKVADAVESWESVLLRDPGNKECLRFIKMAQETGITEAPTL